MADQVSNPGPLALESEELLIGLRSPAKTKRKNCVDPDEVAMNRED